MSKHTPGPWEADRASDHESGIYHQIDAPAPRWTDEDRRVKLPVTVCDTSNRSHLIDPEEDAANALLIGAAPELADALEKGLAFAEADGAPDDDDYRPSLAELDRRAAVGAVLREFRDAARAALKKAGRLP